MDASIRAYRGLLRGETVEWEGAQFDPDGSASVAAEDLWFPNGMVIKSGAVTAPSIAFTIQPDGSLADRNQPVPALPLVVRTSISGPIESSRRAG